MLLHIETQETCTKKSFKSLITEMSKFAEHKINLQKSITFLCTNNEHIKMKLGNIYLQ